MTRNHRPDDGGLAPSTADLHSILVSEERRLVLQFFRDRTERVATIDDLADYVVDRRDGVDDPTEAKLTLHHVSLPKLAAVGVLNYDHRSHVARYRGHVRLESLLAGVPAE